VSLVIANELSLSYGPKVLFEKASFAIGPKDRIGLIGRNGTGKSSLLRILVGDVQPDAGTLQFRRGARPGYLPQDVASLPVGPLVEMVLAAVPGRLELEAKLRATESALQEDTNHEEQLELAQALADLHGELDHFEEHYGRHRAERILAGLGFTESDLIRSTATLSGGWRMRAALAGLLLQDPELLLLDEPTNHLDIPTLEWFEEFLRQSSKAMVLICHDRQFLDRQIDRVLSLEVEGVCSYPGNYERYRAQRALEEEQLEARVARQQARRAEMQSFIDRFGAKNTKARQAQSRQKMLDKEEILEVRGTRATLRFRFGEVPRSGKEVVRIEGVGKAYGAKVVYQDLSAHVLRGQRVGVIGANGAGKTTLLRMISGDLPCDTGRIELGHSVLPAYYAQHHFEAGEASANGTTNSRRTVLETLWELVPERPESYVRSVAGMFLFSGDDVDKPIAVLSGGERARVALARLLLVPANFLIMDEPTNHLDLESSEALIEALKGYGGTLLFVSHNQSFANQLATQIWDVAGGGVTVYPGNLNDYLARRRGTKEGGARVAASPVVDGARQKRRDEAEQRNARSARERPLRQELKELESRIAILEAEEKAAAAALLDPELYQDFARARPHLDSHRAAKEALEDLYPRWEALQRQLEALAAPG
jgi:ATP-binding cassette subfamily F protein 3